MADHLESKVRSERFTCILCFHDNCTDDPKYNHACLGAIKLAFPATADAQYMMTQASNLILVLKALATDLGRGRWI